MVEVRVRLVTEDNSVLARRRRRRHSSGERETWSRKVEYFFASLGYAVGMGNIWRFPYLCYRNGGGAFLIPYLIALIAVGFPILFMEMAFGQFASTGTISIWRICPLFKGIGYAVVVVLLLVNTYYNVLIAYGLFYLFASITDELPWASCDNKWNTPNCLLERFDPNKTVENITALVNGSVPYQSVLGEGLDRKLLKTPTEEFFERHLLRASAGIHDLGDIQWPLIVCLGVSWFTCFMCLFKGIKSLGKVVIFTTMFSYIILTVLFIRGVTLPGSVDGIIYYLKPDFTKLRSLQVWGEASAQAFASLSLGGGGWITLSSYNKFKNKCNRDAVLVGIGNALTSLYAGFVIFSVLGYMAHMKGVPVEYVTSKGPGLAFVAYPEGLSLIPGAPFWSICFFFMMFTVGLDSLFGQVETIAAGIIDEYPEFLRPNRKLFTLFLCGAMFLLGIPLVTQGGIYIVTLMDWYTLLFSFSIISLCEVVVIAYIYGYKRFADDIYLMLGVEPSKFYMVCWLGISPITLVCVIAFLSAHYVPAQYGHYRLPEYAEKIGWLLALGPCALIPITGIFMFFYTVGSFKTFKAMFTDRATCVQVFKDLINPTPDWGPALPENFRRYSARHENGGTNEEVGEDDVFGGAELTGFKPKGAEEDPSEKDRLVKFQDELKVKDETKPEEEADEAGGGDAADTTAADTAGAEEAEEKKQEEDPKV